MKDYNLKRHFGKKSHNLPTAGWRKEDAKNRKITKRICCTTVNVQKVKPRIAGFYSC